MAKNASDSALINMEELIRKIDEFCCDLTIEDLKESLKEDGIDADESYENIRKTLAPYLTLKTE